eukprot:TRINITY_DN797_c0_g2_i2.p1 TRINITY_DN797_c0_g2~~TRINITY_DN797_c0_g2_i2.p1  ORF type:complete len:869 (-),score=15.44 TRINITY_DN797_c0_g2_i2:249-2855(-)
MDAKGQPKTVYEGLFYLFKMVQTVLMVAEKPSLANSIANILSGGYMRSSKYQLDVHEFEGQFFGERVNFIMTSVIGHVYSLDFLSQYNNWEKTEPVTLFAAETHKLEANPKARVCQHLQQCARNCQFLVLWLDCDREGENICFEVIDNTLQFMKRPGNQQQVFRARFSAITSPEIKAAMRNLCEPNLNEALAVDARQELDLRVGCALTRFQTKYFQGKYGNLDSSLISYGPCQIPTLNFCVERYQTMLVFQPEDFWKVQAQITKSGQEMELEWERGRIFDQEVAILFFEMVRDIGRVKVQSIEQQQERRNRPHGLNTVEMLRVASAGLGIGPHQTMQIAERLYTQGFISYPRTESSAYPPNFDIKGTLQTLIRHPEWGNYSSMLLSSNVQRPKGGNDAGDHPPITPVRSATSDDVGGGDNWRLYEYIARHFLASISQDCTILRTKVLLSCGHENFTLNGSKVIGPGFTTIMPWKSVDGVLLPNFEQGEILQLSSIEMFSGKTSPPDYLTESELISLMEKHGIGTDASIPVHINNICERNYVKIQSGRRVVPTELGVTLIKGYQRIDPELCRPQVRAHVERQINLIAKGQANKQSVVAHTINEFTQKFAFFVMNISQMDKLFEASFSPLSASGKMLSKCGKCRRYMKHLTARPQRVYCHTCEEVYDLPQNGSVKLYQGHSCPLDNFELLLFVSQQGQKTPICPLCYNDPPFENIRQVLSGMPCTVCPHPTCRHSFIQQGVTSCPQCEEGTLILEPNSAPNWKSICNRCFFSVMLPKNLHNVKISGKKCVDCGSSILDLSWKQSDTPLQNNETEYKGCLFCDELLINLSEVRQSLASTRRGKGGSRGRGRARRGRGKGRDIDPRMTFHGF